MSYWKRIIEIEKRNGIPRGTTHPNRDKEKYPIEKLEIGRAAKWWFGSEDHAGRKPLGIIRPSTSSLFQKNGRGNAPLFYGELK